MTKPPTEEELAERDRLWRAHEEQLNKNEPSAVLLHRILKDCYPPSPELVLTVEAYQKRKDLFGALAIDIGPVSRGWRSLALATIAFRKWNVEEAFYCVALKEIFEIRYIGGYR